VYGKGFRLNAAEEKGLGKSWKAKSQPDSINASTAAMLVVVESHVPTRYLLPVGV
jgi:hypothetical protein